MSQVATFVKLGSTALLLAALEDSGLDAFPAMPRQPVGAVRGFALDPTLKYAVLCEDDRERTAWDYQDELWHLADDYVERKGADAVAPAEEVQRRPHPVARDARRRARRPGRASPTGSTGWPNCGFFAVSKSATRWRPGDARLHAIDLQYHDLRPERSLAQRVGLRALHSEDAVREAVHNPPEETRAYFRGQCVARYPDEIVAANWDSVVFDLGEGPLQRVPMLDPLRGTRVLTEELLETSATAHALLDALDR